MNLIKKLSSNIFLSGIVILTITLLITLGIEQANKSHFENVDLINQLYSATFKPIFASNQIDKKEVLNFALDGNLFIDSNRNKVLEIQNDSAGHEVFGIREDSTRRSFDYYTQIINKLNVEKQRRIELDSILDVYSNIISKAIYSDENQVYAVDPQIGAIRTKLNKDLSNFIQKKQNVSQRQSNQLAETLKNESKVRNYILFAPDTVYERQYEYVDAANVKIPEPPKIIPPSKNQIKAGLMLMDKNNFMNIKIDTNFVNVTLNNIMDSDSFNDLSFLKTYFIDELNNSDLSFELANDSENNVSLKFSYSDSSNNKIKFGINSKDLEGSVSNSLKSVSGKSLGEWIEYGIKMDSISGKSKRTNSTPRNKK